MDLQVKSLGTSPSGPSLRAAHVADTITIEGEANRVAAKVDPQHNADGTHKDLSTNSITLGGVTKTAWPSGVAGSNGQVLQTGSITLNGVDGVTITHNKGDLNYLVKVSPNGLSSGNVGEISYVKAANTVTVYNSGRPRLTADVELSAIV